MRYSASFSGSLTPRDGKSEEEIEKALNTLFKEYYENKDNTGVPYYEVDGHEEYHEEDYDDLANTFDGQIDFVGEDYARWSLFLKDGKVKETTPLEILPTPDETVEQAIGRYIAENGLNIRQVLEGMPDFIGGKTWFKEEVVSKMDDMEIAEDVQAKILDRAVTLINKEALDELDDSEWNVIRIGIEDALEELGKEAD